MRVYKRVYKTKEDVLILRIGYSEDALEQMTAEKKKAVVSKFGNFTQDDVFYDDGYRIRPYRTGGKLQIPDNGYLEVKLI